jgi:PKD repeat protein
VVRRPGWASGNALVLIVNGTGHRTAYAFDGKAAGAPLLHVEYSTGPVTEAAPVARVSASQLASPALTVKADGSASTDTDATPIATYAFTFGDGASVGPASSATAQHTYAAPGNYTVTLVCTDTGGNVSTTASTTVNVVAAAGGGTIAVFAGYYDTHHPHNFKPKPDPWRGSPNTVFVGAPDKAGGNDWDSSALRVDNLTAGTLSGVVVTADIGSHHYALWGSNSIPPGYHLVLAQTAFDNFDGSDRNAAGCYSCNPNDCLTKVSSVIPVVHVTVGGTTTTYYDTGQQLNTNGADAAGCPYTGTRNDESENWEQVSTQLAGNYVMHRDVAGTVIMAVPSDRALWLGAPFPNPCHGRLTIEFRIADTGEVRLGMYDLAGRLVRSSVKGVLGPGDYRDDLDLSDLAAGAYFCKLETPEGTLHKTFMLVR